MALGYIPVVLMNNYKYVTLPVLLVHVKSPWVQSWQYQQLFYQEEHSLHITL